MMTESHEYWDELAAAHALHALEPDEQLLLLAHVEGCATCRLQLDDYTLVAAQLGSLTDDDVTPPSWADIRTPILGDVTKAHDEAAPVAPVIPMQRNVKAARLIAAAAAVVVVAAGSVVGWQLTRPAPSASTAALTACRHQVGCQIIRLHGQGGDNADVLVVNGTASLVPVTMPKLPSDRMYVLWQLPRDGSPIPVASFSDATRQTSSVPLPTGYADTAAFAVSMETAGPMPTRPTDVLAVGVAPS